MSWPHLQPGQTVYELRYPDDAGFFDPEFIFPDGLTIQLPANWPKTKGIYQGIIWTCDKLTFGMGCVIDLSPQDGTPVKPSKAANGNDGVGWGGNGEPGNNGEAGRDGTTGVDLAFHVRTAVTPKGSLWIRLDGSPGSEGGDGGDGGNGIQGKCEVWGFAGPNGGDGGKGGDAGRGGNGGDTSKVMLEIPALVAHQPPPIAFCVVSDGDPQPSNPPQISDDGAIHVYGAPGAGGRGGIRGRGGSEGGKDNCGLLRTDRRPGNRGADGKDGTSGGGGGAPCFKGENGACRAPVVMPPKP